MKQVYGADEEIGDTYEEQVRVFYVLPGVPGDHEEGISNNNAEKFSQDMKNEIVEMGSKIQADKQKAQKRIIQKILSLFIKVVGFHDTN